jgi:hypothetical protein
VKRENWPVTAESGPAPAGKPDECFYCKVPVGGEHAPDCVIRTRTVVCRVSVVYVREVPEAWDARMIYFQMNESSSCANNLLAEVDTLRKRLDEACQCLCSFVEGEYLREADEDDEEHSLWPPHDPEDVPATDGPDPEPEPVVTIPSDGATKALDVVTQYGDATGEPISEVMPLDAQIGDLVVDLHHLCDREGIKWRDVLSLAAGQYREEVREEGKARRPGDTPPADGPNSGA